MDIAFDIGNTRTKVGLFINNGLHKVIRIDKLENTIFKQLNVELVNRIIISAVKSIPDEFLSLCKRLAPTTVLDHHTALPIDNLYESPSTLGRDRLAAVVGAQFLYPNTSCLVIDAGTCITYDLLLDNGSYLGGNISPGLFLRAKAMNSFTGSLPLVDEFENDELYGRDTQTSLQTGILNGLVAEVNGVIASYKKQYPKVQIVLCGGEARYLVGKLNNKIFANQNLVLLGLHKILLHNDH